LVSLNQSVFIPSKNISENVLLVQEIVRDYHKDKGNPRCTLKVDLMKAYGSIKWDFMMHSLHCFGFPGKFLMWIKECITSHRFTICLNGTPVGYFEGKKGLRQGDPLSPYLFVLAMEVFARIMVGLTVEGLGFKFHHKCLKLRLTHLCFADDLLIFTEASLRSVHTIKATLSKFENLFGLKANSSKSSFFYSGVSDRLKQLLLDDLKMNVRILLVRYLGVPFISTRLTAVNCGVMLEKVIVHIDSWLSRNLSYAGRLQLLTSVIYSLQVYWTCIFILPKSVIKAIEQKFNRFLWNGNSVGFAKVKVSWKDVCYPKREGGLGLKDLEVWNQTSMRRHVWSIFARSGSIWVAWVRGNLLKRKSFWSVGIPQSCSWSWRKILKLRDVAKRFLK
jgi:hypothetical protein